MDTKLVFKIITPEGFDFTEEVDEVVAPGSEGEFGVFPGHIPLITTLNNGVVSYRKGTLKKDIDITAGYVEVGPDRVYILADKAQIKE